MKPAEPQLEHFVAESLSRGLPRPEIETVLLAAGWPLAQIRGALEAYADVPFPVPVPRPRQVLQKPSTSSREAFLYLVLFSTLYFGAFNLADLLSTMIDRLLPDVSEGRSYGYRWDGIRWSTSALVVALPVFLGLSTYIEGQVSKNPMLRLSSVRRWLTYLTLFLASVTLLCDVTVLIYELLGNELTLRFTLKALVVAFIAGTAFSYYLSDLRREEER